MSKGHHCRSVHLFSLLSGWMIVCVCKSATSGTPQRIMGQSVQRSHGSFKNIWCQTMGFGVYSIRDNFILLFSSEELDVECVEKKQAQSCHTLVVILCDLSSRERGPAAVGGGGGGERLCRCADGDRAIYFNHIIQSNLFPSNLTPFSCTSTCLCLHSWQHPTVSAFVTWLSVLLTSAHLFLSARCLYALQTLDHAGLHWLGLVLFCLPEVSHIPDVITRLQLA